MASLPSPGAAWEGTRGRGGPLGAVSPALRGSARGGCSEGAQGMARVGLRGRFLPFPLSTELKPPHIPPVPSCEHLHLHPWPAAGPGGVGWAEPGSPARPAYPEMLPGDKGRAPATPARGDAGRAMGNAESNNGQRGTLCSPQGSQLCWAGCRGGTGWCFLLRASPRSPVWPHFHTQSQEGKESSTYLVCARLSLLLSPAASSVPLGTLRGTLSYLSSQQSTAGSCNGDIFNF